MFAPKQNLTYVSNSAEKLLFLQALLWEKKLLSQDEKLKHIKENTALSIQFTSYKSINKIVPVLVLAQLSCFAALPKFLCNSQFIKMSTPKYYRICEYKITFFFPIVQFIFHTAIPGAPSSLCSALLLHITTSPK